MPQTTAGRGAGISRQPACITPRPARPGKGNSPGPSRPTPQIQPYPQFYELVSCLLIKINNSPEEP